MHLVRMNLIHISPLNNRHFGVFLTSFPFNRKSVTMKDHEYMNAVFNLIETEPIACLHFSLISPLRSIFFPILMTRLYDFSIFILN